MSTEKAAFTRPAVRLTHAGALVALNAAVAKAEAMGVPQNISIVDEGGNLLAFVRMDGAKLLSRETSLSKAISAASHRQPTSRLDPALELKLAIAAGGRLTNLEGGFPIILDGVCVGGIGVGSGKGAEDVEVAKAALAAIGAEV
ncbi:GlcG/HbpS family heme-binding protein [Xanthobacter oligotrophicus]|uniref:GlcG/HbpS family heme-binding protein n=1 Tax=Xanthobacter oligotrophicus TaxID=2607286 RepID=UPI0011F28E97|nr:heme-binding protein [Xanthobacter oligotrophicus]MCG5234430.1 heme-binding protein [Xanthobacter oligotrophicus]